MGCCFSNDENKSTDTGPTERTRLLDNPVSDGPSPPQSSSYNTQPSASQQKGDEQSALNRILHQISNNVIDVAAIESGTMEQHEYMDRAKQYSSRLAMAFSQRQRQFLEGQLPVGVAAPHIVLASQPISVADITLITQAAEQASRALSEVKVRHKEDLVVAFGVP